MNHQCYCEGQGCAVCTGRTDLDPIKVKIPFGHTLAAKDGVATVVKEPQADYCEHSWSPYGDDPATARCLHCGVAVGSIPHVKAKPQADQTEREAMEDLSLVKQIREGGAE